MIEQTLRNWLRASLARRLAGASIRLVTPEQMDALQLRAELAQAPMHVPIMEKATACFAQGRSPILTCKVHLEAVGERRYLSLPGLSSVLGGSISSHRTGGKCRQGWGSVRSTPMSVVPTAQGACIASSRSQRSDRAQDESRRLTLNASTPEGAAYRRWLLPHPSFERRKRNVWRLRKSPRGSPPAVSSSAACRGGHDLGRAVRVAAGAKPSLQADKDHC